MYVAVDSDSFVQIGKWACRHAPNKVQKGKENQIQPLKIEDAWHVLVEVMKHWNVHISQEYCLETLKET